MAEAEQQADMRHVYTSDQHKEPKESAKRHEDLLMCKTKARLAAFTDASEANRAGYGRGQVLQLEHPAATRGECGLYTHHR
jgi:hypothetical protein